MVLCIGWIFLLAKVPRLCLKKLTLKLAKPMDYCGPFNSLYVVVNIDEDRSIGGHSSGVYRLRDTDNDDQLDSIETLQTFEGAGEHGPHSIVPSPDRTSLYMIAGNHTDLPESYTMRHAGMWQEDQLVTKHRRSSWARQ